MRKDGFRLVAFREKVCRDANEVQLGLDEWLRHYNHERERSGKCCRGKNPCERSRVRSRQPGRSFSTATNLTGSARENFQVSD